MVLDFRCGAMAVTLPTIPGIVKLLLNGYKVSI